MLSGLLALLSVLPDWRCERFATSLIAARKI